MAKGKAVIYEKLGFIVMRYCDIDPKKSDTDKICWSAKISLGMLSECIFDLKMRHGTLSGSCTIEMFSQDKTNRLYRIINEITGKGQHTKPIIKHEVIKLDEPIRDLVVFNRELGKYYAYNGKHLFLIEDRRSWKRNLVPAPSERDSLFTLGGALYFHSSGRLYKCENLDELFCESATLVMPKWHLEIEEYFDLYSLYKENRQAGLITWNGARSRLTIYKEDLSLVKEREIALPKGVVAIGLFVIGLMDWSRLTALFALSDGSLYKVDDTYDSATEEEMHYGAGFRHLITSNVGGSLELPSRDLSFAGIGRFIAFRHDIFGFFADDYLYFVINQTQSPMAVSTANDVQGDT